MSQPGPGGDVGLDPDLARVAIDKLRAVREQIEVIQREAIQLAKLPPTAFDPVSLQSFALLSEKASGGPGSLSWALQGGVEYVDRIIAQLEADVAQVLEQDAGAAARIARS